MIRETFDIQHIDVVSILLPLFGIFAIEVAAPRLSVEALEFGVGRVCCGAVAVVDVVCGDFDDVGESWCQRSVDEMGVEEGLIRHIDHMADK